MAYKFLTNLIFEPKGVHDPALDYSIKDTVMSPDGSKVYFALQDVPSGIALADEDYWMLQIDLSGSKNAMDEAVAAFSDYAKIVGTRVKGETAKATGNPVSFLPDAESLLQPVTVLEPQQEGSGEPYPAGGGKNLLNVKRLLSPDGNASNINVTLTGSTLTLEGTPTGAFSQIQENNIIDAASLIGKAITFSGILGGQEPYIAIQCKSANATLTTIALSQTGAATGIVPEGTTKIAIAACLNQSNYVGSACKATYENLQLEIGSSATEYQPWENIRPFIGYDKLDLNHAGKNLLPNASAGTKTMNGIALTSNGDGSYNLKGAASSGASIYFALKNSVTIPGGAYWHLLNEGITGGAAFTPIFSDGTTGSIAFSIANRVGAVAENLTGKTITEFGVYVQGGTTLDITFKPMLCLSDAPSDFAPYQGTLHTVQIGQTVYGGKLDWLTGKLVAEYAMKQIKIDGAWDINLELEGFTRATQSGAVDLQGVYAYGSKDGAWSHGRYLQSWGDASIHAYVNSYAFVMTLPTTLVGTTAESVNAWLSAQHAAGTPVQIAYKLATPVEIQLTPHIISAVDPEQTNTLYGDGSIEVEYVKPLHVSIEERVAAIASAMLMKEE